MQAPAVQAIGPEKTASCFSVAVNSARSVANGAANFATKVALPALRILASKIHELWKLATPALEVACQLAQTKLGIGLGLIGLSIVPVFFSQLAKNHRFLSIALCGLSLILAITGGAFLGSAGLIPKAMLLF